MAQSKSVSELIKELGVKIVILTWWSKVASWVTPVAGTTLFGKYIIFTDEKYAENEETLIHELVHIFQQRELGFIKFLYLYLKEYFELKKIYKDSTKAYRNISFEIQARRIADMDNPAEIMKYVMGIVPTEDYKRLRE